jgi:hypothetical protein
MLLGLHCSKSLPVSKARVSQTTHHWPMLSGFAKRMQESKMVSSCRVVMMVAKMRAPNALIVAEMMKEPVGLRYHGSGRQLNEVRSVTHRHCICCTKDKTLQPQGQNSTAPRTHHYSTRTKYCSTMDRTPQPQGQNTTAPRTKHYSPKDKTLQHQGQNTLQSQGQKTLQPQG